ncbi:hypothetical protein Gobs01_01700 [Geodermatophilus obscurus DSM 43160]
MSIPAGTPAEVTGIATVDEPLVRSDLDGGIELSEPVQ